MTASLPGAPTRAGQPLRARRRPGLLANHRYAPGSIERNHEPYTNDGEVICSPAVRGLLGKAEAKAPAVKV